jgi:hypothetical protein
MKRVACLQMAAAAVCAAGMMLVGCDKGPEKVTIDDIHLEMPGAPVAKIDGAGGVALPPIKVAYADSKNDALIAEYEMRKRQLAIGAASANTNSGGGDTTNNTAETKPTDPGEAGLIGVWKAVKLDPEPSTPEQAAELMKKGVEFKKDYTFHVLEDGKPTADEGGTWKIVDGAIEISGAAAFDFKVAGKQLTLKAGGTSVIMEK